MHIDFYRKRVTNIYGNGFEFIITFDKNFQLELTATFIALEGYISQKLSKKNRLKLLECFESSNCITI